jgi:hypothetical protein
LYLAARTDSTGPLTARYELDARYQKQVENYGVVVLERGVGISEKKAGKATIYSRIRLFNRTGCSSKAIMRLEIFKRKSVSPLI